MVTEIILNELINNTYARLKPSGLHGIGVFAIKEIPQGCRDVFTKSMGSWIKVSRNEIDNLPNYAKDLVETYCLFDDDWYYVPAEGFKVMDLVFFLNHSDTPNIISINDGEAFETLRVITAGEELLINYGEIVTDES